MQKPKILVSGAISLAPYSDGSGHAIRLELTDADGALEYSLTVCGSTIYVSREGWLELERAAATLATFVDLQRSAASLDPITAS